MCAEGCRRGARFGGRDERRVLSLCEAARRGRCACVRVKCTSGASPWGPVTPIVGPLTYQPVCSAALRSAGSEAPATLPSLFGSACLSPMQRALLAARPLLRAGLRRSLSATAPAAAEPAAAAAAAPAAAAAAPAAAVVTTQSSSLWHKLLAFSAGLAVGGAYYVATMQDTWRNDDALERSVAALRRETVRGCWRGRLRLGVRGRWQPCALHRVATPHAPAPAVVADVTSHSSVPLLRLLVLIMPHPRRPRPLWSLGSGAWRAPASCSSPSPFLSARLTTHTTRAPPTPILQRGAAGA